MALVSQPGPPLPPRPDEAELAVEADLRRATVEGQVATGTGNVQILAQAGARLDVYGQPGRAMTRRENVRALPRDLDPLIGRDLELQALREVLGSPLVQVFGSDGVGKTALLRHLLWRLDNAHFPTVIYQSCRDRHPLDVLRAIFSLLFDYGGPFVANEGELAQLLGTIDAIVVLDEVHWTRDQLSVVLNTAPACAFVVAGPRRLVFGEGVPHALRGLTVESAKALIERALGREIGTQDVPRVERANERLNGNPQRLLRLAAVVEATGEPLGTLIDRFLPTNGPGGDPTIPVDDDAAEVLVLLAAVFGKPLEQEHIGLIAGVPRAETTLERLEAAGLVESHSPRYSLRAPVMLNRTADSKREQFTRRALSFFAAWSRAGDPVEVVASAGTLLRLAEWALMSREYADALAIVRGIDVPLAASGQWEAWSNALRIGLVAAEALEDLEAQGWLHHQIGTRAAALDQRAIAEAHLQAALALRETSGNPLAREVTQHNLTRAGGASAVVARATPGLAQAGPWPVTS